MDLKRFTSEILPLRQKLVAFAWKMLENEEDAEDVVQETLLRLWSIRGELEKMSNPGGFAMQTVKNSCIDRLRQKKYTVDINEVSLEYHGTNPYTETEKQNSIDLIKQLIDGLPELQRRIIRMRDVEGYELEEIAAITGTQVSAVTVNLSRARKKVRDQFISINAYKIKTES